MKEIKRAVCLMLCFVMAFGLLPVHANALDLDVSELQPGEFVEEIIAGDALEEPEEGTPAELAASTATGNLSGGTKYELDANGVDAGAKYLIVSGNSGTVSAFRNDNGTRAGQAVSVSNNTIASGFDYESSCVWTFSNGWSISNGDQKIRLNNNDILDKKDAKLKISDHLGDGAYQISADNYYLRYRDNSWKRYYFSGNVYLFKQVTGDGSAVTFNVAPSSVELAPGEKQLLTGSVVVGTGAQAVTIPVSDCVITWNSEKTGIATVSGGTVTAVADGTTNVTAKLTEVRYQGQQVALANGGITVTIPVTVTTKTIVPGSYKLIGDTHISTKLKVEPDFSGVKLQVTYSDNTKGVITIANGLMIDKTDYKIDTAGIYPVTVSYGAFQGEIVVVGGENLYEGLEDATVYPVYPEDGAVRIDKTATELDLASTGLVQVELDVAGVSVKGAVDVILVTDLSNSMAWEAGGRTDASSHEATKMYDLAVSVNSFADTFLADNEDGSATRNTLSLVTFGGYDKDHTKKVYSGYADPTQTLVLGTKDAAIIKNTINNIRVLADDALNRGTSSTGYYLSFDGGRTYGENYGNTNYDHAFMQTADAIAALKNAYENENEGTYAESGRQIYVIFMTDGAPSNYDGVYYNYRTGDRADVNCTWVNANGQEVTYTMGNKNAQYSQADWFKYIAGSAYNATTQTITGNPLYWADQVYNTPGVADIISVGFDLDNGGFSSMVFTEAAGTPLAKVLEKLVTGKTLTVHSADDQAGMKEIYDKLATKLRYAGTSATVADVIDPDFTLQIGNFVGTVGQGIGQVNLADRDPAITPCITIKTYDLWTKAEVDADESHLIGTSKGTSQDIETVTFNADGTEAYSNLVFNEDGSKKNILDIAADGTITITAKYFTYTNIKGRETFNWSIGNITDKEIALSYHAYLKDSLEGKEPDGLKYTNENATLEYIDINGKHATKVFPIPAVAWGGASTSYEFYLVNEAGKPCDRNGKEIPFANRIIITGPFFQPLYLNQSDEEFAQEIIAVKVLPAGYTLYDETAMYTVQTSSSNDENKQGSLKISEPAAGKAQTTKLVSAVTPSYIQSRVAFGVMYNDIPGESDFVIAPDAVVIDYGKEIIIDVNSNNTEIPSDVTAELIGFSMFYDHIDVTKQFSNTAHSTPFAGSYGTFNIITDGDNAGKVSYTPHKMVNNVGKVFCVYRLTKETDTYYMVSELDVIPATIMYYETDFADWYESVAANKVSPNERVFVLNGFSESLKDEIAADGPQNDGTIGQNTYGFDDSYDNDKKLSNGSSLYAEGAGVTTTTATFSFTGTGFDLISRTGAEQGMIKVQVATDSNMTNIVRSVAVLNKSESSLELYQIPVVSINGLPHGTYYVKVGVDVGYSNPDFSMLNRGNQFYFDAIRVYDPVMDNTIAEDAYKADGELNNDIDEVRQMLISANDFNALVDSTNGVVFVDNIHSGEVDEEGKPVVGESGGVGVADYTTIGPNNEVYLSKGQAVAFKVASTVVPASFDVGAKSVTGADAKLDVTVRNLSGTVSWNVTKEICSSTVQFIDLLPQNSNLDLFKNNDVYVVITNTGDGGVLSITDLKAAYGNRTTASEFDELNNIDTITHGKFETESNVKPQERIELSYTVDAYTLDVARMVLTGAEPEVPEVPETPEKPETPDVDTSFYKIQNVLIKINGSVKNQKCTFTVVTSQKVEDIEIVQNGAELMPARSSFKDKKSGERVWTIELRIGTYDKNGIFNLTGIGENGVRGESVAVNYMKNR